MLYSGAKQEREKTRRKISSGLRVKDSISVVITSYELVLRDRQFLAKTQWKFIVVDEGHRLKNLNCRCVGRTTLAHCSLLRELKQFKTSNRLILTGTPLHVRCVVRVALMPEQPHGAVGAPEFYPAGYL